MLKEERVSVLMEMEWKIYLQGLFNHWQGDRFDW